MATKSKILVVDDEDTICEVLKLNLEKWFRLRFKDKGDRGFERDSHHNMHCQG